MNRALILMLAAAVACCGAIDAKKRVRRHAKRHSSQNEVWTHLGGTYIFSGSVNVAIEFALESEPRIERIIIDDVNYDGYYNKRNHLITATHSNGVVVFSGKIYDGGNLLKGRLHGKPIALRNPCGL